MGEKTQQVLNGLKVWGPRDNMVAKFMFALLGILVTIALAWQHDVDAEVKDLRVNQRTIVTTQATIVERVEGMKAGQERIERTLDEINRRLNRVLEGRHQ